MSKATSTESITEATARELLTRLSRLEIAVSAVFATQAIGAKVWDHLIQLGRRVADLEACADCDDPIPSDRARCPSCATTRLTEFERDEEAAR